MLDPVAVALKFGFLAVLYLFLLWTARAGMRDLRQTARGRGFAGPIEEEGTGVHAAAGAMARSDDWAPRLRIEQAAGLRSGAAYDLRDGAVLGRGDDADIPLEDSFASGQHLRLAPQGDSIVAEDLGSTNGTYLNGERLTGPRPLHAGDRLRIGDSEFTFER